VQKYISLHNHDTYSIKDGLYKPTDFLTRAKELGATAYAQTNHGTMAGVFDFYDSCQATGIKPILGVEAYFVDDKTSKDKPYHILLLAKNLLGYKALLKAQYDACKLGFYYKPRIDWNDLKEMRGNVIVSSACISGVVAKPLVNKDMDRVKMVVEKLKDWFGNDFYMEYIALGRTSHYKPVWNGLYEVAKKYGIKSIITTDTHYIHKQDYKLQQILHNLDDEEIKITDIQSGKGWNMEDNDLYLKSYSDIMEIMSQVFEPKVVEECLANTLEIGGKVEVYPIYPKEYVFPKIEFKEEEMKNIIRDNLKKKISAENMPRYQERLKYEYGVIKSMGFLEYFWIVQDIVRWSKSNDIMVGPGRGSAAGSLVSYLLDLTDIDPLRFGLSFERFLNPTRKKMPDIDTDFQKSQRSKVLEYMKKYGENNVIQIGSYNGLTLKSALKDILRMNNISMTEANFVSENIEDPKIKEKYAKHFEVAEKLQGNIRHLSKHAAGVVITDKPVWEYLPVVYNSSVKDVVTAIDGDTLTSKKFLKMDILGLKALDMIKDTIEYIIKYENKKVDILDIELNDDNILSMYRSGDVNNIFQFDTYLMRKFLPEVAPDRFKHLVESNAINRPGPLTAGMADLYVQRRFGAKYTAPKLLDKHLEKTFGLLIYQEQVISILADLLDISAGQADVYRKQLEKSSIKDILNENNYYTKLYERYSKEDVEEAMNFIQNSAGYLFNKSHSVSYSFLGYQMAYLKCYYRKYFILGVLNNLDVSQKQDQEKMRKTLDECAHQGFRIKPNNLNEISVDFTLDPDGNIIAGAKAIKGLGEKGLVDIVVGKPYKDLTDLLTRVKPHKNVLERLNEEKFIENTFGEVISNEDLIKMRDNMNKKRKGATAKLKTDTMFD